MEYENMTTSAPEDTAVSQAAPQEKEPPAMVKKIGKMTYIVRVHFSTTSKETFSDKVKRLLREEVRQMMENETVSK